MAELQVNYRSIADLKTRKSNPRTHSDAQIKQIMRSIEHFGFTNPVLVDDVDGVIAGHGRIEAAKRLGHEAVPAISLGSMSEADVRAYVIADNKLAENAGWDVELLALEFEYLDTLDVEFDLTLTGFELPEIDVALQSIRLIDGEDDVSDQMPDLGSGPAITRRGDIWKIGNHRLICGDSTQRETFEELLGAKRAQMTFSDPPYNVPIDGHVSGNGAVKHREFAMAAGEMSSEEFTDFLVTVFRHQAAFSEDGSIHFQCMDWRHMAEILDAGRSAYNELKNLCVWAKSNGGMGSLYRSQHELVFVFKSGKARHINNVELGKHGRNRTNLWNYAGANTFGLGQGDLSLHPTVKPVALIRDAILDCSHRDQIVLDAFSGSGSTLMAAAQTGRCGYGIELDPVYCDITIKRMISDLGLSAYRLQDQLSFDEAESAVAILEVENV